MLAEARLRQVNEHRAAKATSSRLEYDAEGKAMARERTLTERQMVQEAEDRIKSEQALESIAIARLAEDEDAAFLAARRAELDAEVRRAQEARLNAEREATTAAAKRSAAEARAGYEAGRKAEVLGELSALAQAQTGETPRRVSRWRVFTASLLALLIGAAIGGMAPDPARLWHTLTGTGNEAGELKLRLDDTLQSRPAR
jgi:hypothetical protein